MFFAFFAGYVIGENVSFKSIVNGTFGLVHGLYLVSSVAFKSMCRGPRPQIKVPSITKTFKEVFEDGHFTNAHSEHEAFLKTFDAGSEASDQDDYEADDHEADDHEADDHEADDNEADDDADDDAEVSEAAKVGQEGKKDV